MPNWRKPLLLNAVPAIRARMAGRFTPAEVRRWVRLIKGRGLSLMLVAGAVGAMTGALVTGMSWIVQWMHVALFGLQPGARLSAMFSLSGWNQAFVPALGGAIIGLSSVYLRTRQFRTPIDPIEANSLHGGRLSVADTLIVAFQTIVSSGFGASVGLEAAYTQTGAGLASRLARTLGLRRGDVRVLVGCGAGGAIAAAFGAPLTGAFYGFELIIGVYSVANVAPVMAAALCASLTAGFFGEFQFPIDLGPLPPMSAANYPPFIALGLLAGAASIAVMYLVTLVERLLSRLAIDALWRPMFGGCVIGLLGLLTPQVLSGGHGALHRELVMNYGVAFVAELFVLKVLASAVSLGSGFRGGLFFASLFLGALLGKMFAAGMLFVWPQSGVDPLVAAVVGMSAFAVGVVGGPLTMTFLALEATGNLAVTGIVLAACMMSTILVRETFGYSFSTWRFHLRGETIRGAQDVGWMRNLTVGSMMRKDIGTVPADITLAGFRNAVPLGSSQRVILTDADNVYAGMVAVAEIHALNLEKTGEAEQVRNLVMRVDTVLVPTMNVKAAADAFGEAKSEELAVVDDYVSRRVVGLLTEAHLLRRYAEELDKNRRDLAGDG